MLIIGPVWVRRVQELTDGNGIPVFNEPFGLNDGHFVFLIGIAHELMSVPHLWTAVLVVDRIPGRIEHRNLMKAGLTGRHLDLNQ